LQSWPLTKTGYTVARHGQKITSIPRTIDAVTHAIKRFWPKDYKTDGWNIKPMGSNYDKY
jgi:hypothetical protein